MQRITTHHLEVALERINTKAGHGPNPKYGTPGAYMLDWAYGGVKLVQVCGDSHGQRNITYGFETKRATLDMMNAFLAGMEAIQ